MPPPISLCATPQSSPETELGRPPSLHVSEKDGEDDNMYSEVEQ